MSWSLKQAAGGALAACAVLASATAAAEGPPLPPLGALGQGPAGRQALARWRVALDPLNRGLARGWQRGGFPGRSVGVPDVVDARDIKGPAGRRNYEGSVAWYETSFQAPSAGTYALSFASANFQATAFLDGRAIVSHRGSYVPFEGRARLGAGRHTLVVRIDWRDPASQSRAGFHRTWFNWGGLDGAVSVRPVGLSELLEPTVQTTLQSAAAPSAQPAGETGQPTAALVRVGVRVRNNGPARVLAPAGTLLDGAQRIALQFAPRTLAQGQSASFNTTVAVGEPQLWSPQHPNLYTLSLAIAGESGYSARVGLRELRWRGGRIYLNGAPLKLRGASIQADAAGHGDALSAADEDRFVSELQAIGANTVRSQHPLPPGLLERLDAAGILVWQGIGPVEGAGNWYPSTPGLLREAEQQARGAALAAQLHPSIIAWNLVNEVAENGRNAAEVDYVQLLCSWLHEHDPTRMVAVDVWGDHPPLRAGLLYRDVDAVAETDYTGWYDSPGATPGEQRALIRARLAAQERTFAGKVLIISEFGAESNTLNPPGAPGSYGFQTALLARHIAVYSADPKLSGMLIWDLRDYPLNPDFEGGSIHGKLPRLRLIEGLNQKGLFTYGGAPKPAVETVARLFRSLREG